MQIRARGLQLGGGHPSGGGKQRVAAAQSRVRDPCGGRERSLRLRRACVQNIQARQAHGHGELGEGVAAIEHVLDNLTNGTDGTRIQLGDCWAASVPRQQARQMGEAQLLVPPPQRQLVLLGQTCCS